MLASINVWADGLALLIVIFSIFFWIYEVLGNMITGRWRRKFRYGEWPYHYEKIKVIPRIMHFVHVGSMIALGVSGIYIRFPMTVGLLTAARTVHFYAMYIVPIVLVARVTYAVIFDGKEFLLSFKDIKNMVNVVGYYALVKKGYDHFDKYNGMQKMTYGILFPVGLLIQMYTGFGLLWPKILLAPFIGMAGGVDAVMAFSRVTHFMTCMILIMFTLIHICLSFLEDFPALLVFFGLRRQYDEEDYYDEDEEYYDEESPEDSTQQPAATETPQTQANG